MLLRNNLRHVLQSLATVHSFANQWLLLADVEQCKMHTHMNK